MTPSAASIDPERYRLRHQVIAAVPSVQALGLRLDQDWEDALAEAFERAMSGRPQAELEARLLAGSLMGTVAAFHRAWAAGGFRQDPAEYRDRVLAVFAHGATSVTGNDPAAG